MEERIRPEDTGPLADWTEQHRSEYISSGGAKGHVMDVRILDGHKFATMLLLRCKGRKSGKTFINGLLYANFRGEVIVAGTKNGADSHPAWYLNLQAGSDLAVQIATQAYAATWREPEGEELEAAWEYFEAVNPRSTTYRGMTDRKIPLLLISLVEEIPVFTETD